MYRKIAQPQIHYYHQCFHPLCFDVALSKISRFCHVLRVRYL